MDAEGVPSSPVLAHAVPGTAKGILPSPVHLSLPAVSFPPDLESMGSVQAFKPERTLVPQSGRPSLPPARFPSGATFPALRCLSQSCQKLRWKTSPAPFPLFNCSSYLQDPWEGAQGPATVFF